MPGSYMRSTIEIYWTKNDKNFIVCARGKFWSWENIGEHVVGWAGVRNLVIF